MGEIKLTWGQQKAFDTFKAFLEDDTVKVYILKGYAGTGKTTLMRKFIEEMQKRQLQFSLLASTGRAAKILANVTGCETKTVHSEIYKFRGLNQDLEEEVKKRDNLKQDSSGQLFLNFELDTVAGDSTSYYIVDEASMISDAEDKNTTQAIFGSGRLLTVPV